MVPLGVPGLLPTTAEALAVAVVGVAGGVGVGVGVAVEVAVGLAENFGGPVETLVLLAATAAAAGWKPS